MPGFFSLSPNQLAILAAVVAIVLTENLNLNEQNSLGNFLQTVGQSMLTVNAQQQLLEDKVAALKELEGLKSQLCRLEQEIKRKSG